MRRNSGYAADGRIGGVDRCGLDRRVRKRNGGKALDAFLKPVSSDKLVLWGWDPGAGRAPVSVPHDEFVAATKTWIAGGAPCP